MTKKLVVLDFDGTMTDAEKEALPFREGYEADLAAVTGIPLPQIASVMCWFENKICKDPAAHACKRGGHLVAPAAVDPYIRATEAARLLFDAGGLFPNSEKREAKLKALFADNYPKTATVFRDGARQAITDLQRVATIYIVTNSKTEPVTKKLKKLGAAFPADRVLESAEKFSIDPSSTHIPESLECPLFPRPVLLRRRRYYEVLERICLEHDVPWRYLTVVGDIFELDLALPLMLGCRVALVANGLTPRYEIEFLERYYWDRARVLRGLHEVVPFVAEK